MASGSIHVKVSGPLQTHIQQQIGEQGLYENASEYIRALIRNDLKNRAEAWEWLEKELGPGLRADDSDRRRDGKPRSRACKVCGRHADLVCGTCFSAIQALPGQPPPEQAHDLRAVGEGIVAK